jgi:ubiquinone/menaquinone biosynthesis C-methylase UbiE
MTSVTTTSRGLDVNLRSGPQMREYVAIADRIAQDRPARILDWGCGHGQVSAMLRERGMQTDSFDYAAGLDGVTKRQLPEYPEIEATLSPEPVKLPYEDEQFDAVLSLGVLEHVADPDGSLDELRRILKPGGRLYVYKLPNRASYLEWIAKKLGWYYHGKLEHDRLYNVREAVEIVERHGFQVDEARLFNMLPLTISHPLAHRFAAAIWRLNQLLSRVPGLRVLATNVEVLARKR